jgi:hypothetical protein
MVWYFFEIDHIHAFRFFSAASRDLVEAVSPWIPEETAGEVSATQLQSYEAMKSNCRVMADYSRYQNPDL